MKMDPGLEFKVEGKPRVQFSVIILETEIGSEQAWACIFIRC